MRFFANLLLRQPPDLRLQHDVVENRAPIVEGVVLKHDADVCERPIDDLALDFNSSGRGLLQPGCQKHQGAFAAAARPQDREELAAADVDGDVTQRDDVTVIGLAIL